MTTLTPEQELLAMMKAATPEEQITLLKALHRKLFSYAGMFEQSIKMLELHPDSNFLPRMLELLTISTEEASSLTLGVPMALATALQANRAPDQTNFIDQVNEVLKDAHGDLSTDSGDEGAAEAAAVTH